MNFERYAGVASAVGLMVILLITVWLGLWGPAAHQLAWTDVGEFIKVLGSIATGAAAVTGAFVAWRGLEKWRSETVGKKRYELAAAVLADFYEMNEIIRTSRAAFVLAHELAPVEGLDEAVMSLYAPERRLLEHQEFFPRFRTRKHEFAAYFGKEPASLFDDLWKIRLEINWAVGDMIRHKEVRSSRRPDDVEMWRSWHRVAFADPREGQDPIAAKLDKIIAGIEAICRPAIEAQVDT
jgi:hypothetical protein